MGVNSDTKILKAICGQHIQNVVQVRVTIGLCKQKIKTFQSEPGKLLSFPISSLLRKVDLGGKENRREFSTVSQGMATSTMSKNKVETGAPVSGTPTMMDNLSNYIIVDIGANLTNKKFSRDLDQVIQRATDAGVSKIMVTGTSLHSTKEALRLTRLYPGTLYSTAGIHPHDAKSWDEETYNELKEAARCTECVAIGECELGKPLFLHERDAHQEMVSILERFVDKLPSCVIHCFTGNREQAIKYLQLGCYIGLTGYLWKDKSENGVRRILEEGVIPLDKLLVETDAPFMYPNTRASKLPQHIKDCLTERSVTFLQRYCTFQRNEPCSLPVTVEMIAAYLNKTPEEVALATTFNALKVFGLSG